jgi:hypothetical protein
VRDFDVCDRFFIGFLCGFTAFILPKEETGFDR